MAKVLKESEVAGDGLPDTLSNGRWYLFCPGCYAAAKEQFPDKTEFSWMLGALHCFSEKVHQFNGDVEKPTLSPSLLVSSTRGESRCHSFVNNGMIQFLGDCIHPLANQTVELLDAQPYLDGIKSRRTAA